MKSIRNRGKKELIHPIFLECKACCPSEYWKGVFEDFAYGKYPKQIYIHNFKLQSTNRKKYFEYTFKNKTPEIMVDQIIELLNHHTDLISSEEIKKKKDNNEPYKKDVWITWKDIKRKYIKDILLMEYALSLKKNFSLTYRKTSSFCQKLMVYVYSGQITTIHMSDGKIDNIEGIDVDENGEIIFTELNDSKQELVCKADDYMHYYCRRYMLRSVKLIHGVQT
jgi:hypothetical protein